MAGSLDRRSFLKLGAVTGAAAAGLGSGTGVAGVPPAGAAAVRVQRYVRLGRTGLEVSDISFGSSRLRHGEEHLVHHALSCGVNYFDTAESYTEGESEQVLGRALKGQRDKVFIATKTATDATTTSQAMMQALEASLRRLQTDHVDVYFSHAVNDPARLRNPEWRTFVELAKQQGKIRFSGMSGHAGRLVECIDYGLDEDLLDVILVAYNFGQDPAFYEHFTRSFDFVAVQPELPRVIKKAREKNVGVIAMKVLRGARLNDMRPFEQGGATYAQAAFRWVLSNTQVNASIISMTSREQIDEYLGASGDRALTEVDLSLLEQYARLTNLTYCRHACNDCEGACPLGVSIADVLRTRMYATDYQDLDFARREYAALGPAASACLGCDGQPCRHACSHGIPIASLVGPTHLLLGSSRS